MKRVLITGANSYLGDNVKMYLEKCKDYYVNVLDMLDNDWVKFDFANYDVVLNVCAIVHRFEKTDDSLYYQVNRDLAVKIANKAKESKVKQFIQISTDGVFGVELGEISPSTKFNPKTAYEKSKYEADIELEKYRCNNFKVCIIRPPLIYGKDCKGNFPKLVKFALKSPFFPSKKNRRDMIYIENICDFIKYAIENELDEICYPRDNEQVVVCEMIKQIAELNGKKIILCGIFNPFVLLLYKSSHKLRSVFGNYHYTGKICEKCNWEASYNFRSALKKMFGDNL